MDILYFLTERTTFIRQFYATAASPYLERMRKIEAEQEPYVPEYDDDCVEPPFLDEWLESSQSIATLAHICVSMLAAALHLYFDAWVRYSGMEVPSSLKESIFKRKGWLSGYIEHFSQNLNIRFEDSNTNLELLEEIVLARNRSAHPSSIVDSSTRYNFSDLKKLSSPFFVHPIEWRLIANHDSDELPAFFLPKIHVDEAKLHAAIDEVEKLANWFESKVAR
ncbi:MAG: hypothetical protein KGJ44_07235 [Betaproteobacteria bacterium]|nr:hypothetical protein [Betaproteobacteria bacterium]